MKNVKLKLAIFGVFGVSAAQAMATGFVALPATGLNILLIPIVITQVEQLQMLKEILAHQLLLHLLQQVTTHVG